VVFIAVPRCPQGLEPASPAAATVIYPTYGCAVCALGAHWKRGPPLADLEGGLLPQPNFKNRV
jgi:hypothetical protein